MTASTGSDQLGGVDTNVPGLTEQIANIETLVAKLVTNNEEMVRSQQENVINGNTETAENNVDKVTELQEIISDKERMMQEMMTKFGRNRQILTNNWEQAESEVRRLDDIYHDTVDRVVTVRKPQSIGQASEFPTVGGAGVDEMTSDSGW